MVMESSFPGKKHIIMISLDTLRADCIGPAKGLGYSEKYGIKYKPWTGCIDEVLARGTFFSSCISAAPFTTASHAAIFTGFWPLKNNVYEYYNCPISKPTVFEYAKENGYLTIFKTDFPIMLGEAMGFRRGVDYYFIEDEQAALETLLKNRGKKTFSFFHFGGIHYPYGFHKLKFGGNDYKSKVDELEKRYDISGGFQLGDMLDETFRDKDDKELLFRYKRIIERLYNQGLYKDLFMLYLEGIEYFMRNRLSAFMKTLLEFADEEDCILVIFGDHGEEWSEDSFGHFNSVSEGVLRVPLIIYGRGVPAKTVSETVRTIDIGATIMSLISHKPTDGIDGADLRVLDNDNSQQKDMPAFSQSWIHPDNDELRLHQEKSTKGGSIENPISTYKRGESVYCLCSFYSRLFDLNGKIIKEHFRCSDTENKSSILNEARKMLEDYNKNLKHLSGTQFEKPNNVRNELKLMGYRI